MRYSRRFKGAHYANYLVIKCHCDETSLTENVEKKEKSVRHSRRFKGAYYANYLVVKGDCDELTLTKFVGEKVNTA